MTELVLQRLSIIRIRTPTQWSGREIQRTQTKVWKVKEWNYKQLGLLSAILPPEPCRVTNHKWAFDISGIQL